MVCDRVLYGWSIFKREKFKSASAFAYFVNVFLSIPSSLKPKVRNSLFLSTGRLSYSFHEVGQTIFGPHFSER